ncbi:antibiotic biosynthesis monooxygenase [Methylotenera sp. 1P/1]|uniref:antibiotic biosynthesis monooxygenase n=1 Tax=Methylotenera sp. 1P/1 TaxID=1131551 RepID=UPI00039A1DF7|nr:antibiotic biosynthesis monooxygenase [Methylotenera sp. 1P/1]
MAKSMPERLLDQNGAQGASVVITHRVLAGKQPEYEAWLNEIGPVCKASEGLLDLHVVRPISGITDTYTIIIRYDTEQHLKQWMTSDARKQLIAKTENMRVGSDDFYIRSGLDFWFAPEGAKAKIPVRWKQFLITWSAIYPMVTFIPLVLIPLLRQSGLPANHYIDTLILTAILVFMMVYVVMPRYTKWVRNWLFK